VQRQMQRDALHLPAVRRVALSSAVESAFRKDIFRLRKREKSFEAMIVAHARFTNTAERQIMDSGMGHGKRRVSVAALIPSHASRLKRTRLP
jgi:hypothetical protein